MTDSASTDTTNRFLVGVNVRGDQVSFMRAIPRTISRDDALNLAAWIVAVVNDDNDGDFDTLLAEIRKT